MKDRNLKELWILFWGMGASALMLTFIQAPFNAGVLAWVSLVPFIFVCSPDVPKWRLVWVSYFVSVLYWLGNLYWIGIVTVPACILFCLYMGLYWPVVALCIRWCRRPQQRGYQLGLFLMVPLIFVGAEAWQGTLITGFNWRLLAHSQWKNLVIIQLADTFGELGVSFLVAMVNGLFAELLIDKVTGKAGYHLNKHHLAKACVVGAAMAGAVFYGYFRLSQSKEFIEDGPIVGSVQPNVPSQIKELSEEGEKILIDLIHQSEKCMEAGAQLVAWPETMVLTSLNRSYVSQCREDTIPVEFDRMISNHTKGKAYVLTGAHAVNLEMVGSEYVITDRFNSAFMYGPDGRQDIKRYDKIHLVPFGEYIPFKDSVPFIYNIVMKLSPYDYDYHLTKGRYPTRFEIDCDGEKHGFGVLICYEDTDGSLTRKTVLSDEHEKKADWIVNVSNDGWYVWYRDGKVLPSVELSQRTVITVFRAVENRISIIRSVNTGISCLIDSTGKIRDGFIRGNLPDKSMDRQAVAGWFVDQIGIDNRVTFFTKHGPLLKFFCATALIVVIILSAIHKPKKRTERD